MTAQPDASRLIDALSQAAAEALGTILGGTATVAPSPPASGHGWSITGAVTGGARGSLETWIDLASAETLARHVTGVETPDEAAILGLLRDLWSRAATTVCGQGEFNGLAIAFGSARTAGAPPRAATFELKSREYISRIALTARLFAAPADDVSRENLNAVLDIDLPLIVRFGRTTLPLRTLSALGPGSVVDMERSPDDPVDIVVGDRVIARGDVVVVGGNYGVRITEVISPDNRVRGLEA